MAVIIRKAETEKDLKGKAYVHWKSWHEAYAGFIDKSYLDRMTLEKCEEIALKFSDHLLIAEDDGKVIGFVSYGDCRDEDLADTGEVYAIYILEEYYGQGIGGRLMKEALKELEDLSLTAVWVLKENGRAIRFYERFGFHPDGKEKEIRLGTPVVEIRMVKRKEDVI